MTRADASLSSIQILVNASAGRLRGRRGAVRSIVRLAAGRAGMHVTERLEELPAAVDQVLGAEPELIVLCGGDGTFMATLSELERRRGDRPLPPVVLAPGGTVAQAARSYGQKSSLSRTLTRVLAGPPLPPPVAHPTLRVEADGAARVGFTFGTGLVARFFERYVAEGARGRGAAARIALRTFVGSLAGDAYAKSVLEPLPCRITVDGSALAPRAYSLVVASVLGDVGIGVRVAYRAAEDPLRPHLIASPLLARQLGWRSPSVLLGRSIGGEGLFDGLVERAEVGFDGEGPWVLDGDLFRSGAVAVSAGPLVRVVVI